MSGQDDVIAAARTGAEWALTVLYRESQPALVRYLAVHAPGEQEDLAADVWIEIARALPAFEGDREGFRRLLFTIGRRRAIDHHRKRRRHPRRADLSPPEIPTNAPAPDEAVIADLDADAAIAQIRALLPPVQAEIVILRVVADLSVTDVAQIVGRRAAAVSVIQHRALRRLARALGETRSFPNSAKVSTKT
ncbi:MAG: RNA polymerase sigma factor [Acidimicrobiales bacterium]